MPNCDEYVELISAAVDGALSPEEEGRLAAHLAGCPHCREVLADFQAIHAQMNHLPPVEAPAGLADRILEAVEQDNVTPMPAKKTGFHWKRWAACAAVLILVLAGGFGLGFLSGSGGDSADTAACEAAPAAAGDAQAVEPETADAAAMPETASLDGAEMGETNTFYGSRNVTLDETDEDPAQADAPAEIPAPSPTDAAARGIFKEVQEAPASTPPESAATGASQLEGSAGETNGLPTSGAAAPEGTDKTVESAPDGAEDEKTAESAELTPSEALDRLLEEKGFTGWEERYDTGVSWPRDGEVRDNLVYDVLSDNGKYYIFVSYRNVYDSADAETPSHNSRNGAYAVPLDGGEILEETGPEFWERMSQ